MKKFTALLAFLLFVGMQVVNAQDRTITGTVTGADGNPIPGANIVLKGTTQGAITDLNGKYSISVPSGEQTLIFSFIGMQTKEIVTSKSTTLDVALNPASEMLTDVVVTALGISREKKALGYAVQEVKGDGLAEKKDVNVVNSLAGKVAGVQITGSSGNMGGSARITIRGVNSITGENQPLFVVDGVPVDNSNFGDVDQQRGSGGYDYGNAIQDMNPEDIESVSVLKGAGASALYGSRGANGVIVITTKKGKKGKKGLGVTYNAGFRMEQVYVLPKYQNEYGGGFKFNKLYYDENPELFGSRTAGHYTEGNRSYDLVPQTEVDESWGPKLQGQEVRHWWSFDKEASDFGEVAPWEANPDNVRDFFETGLTWTNNITLTGSNDKGSFRLSYTNLDQKFVLPKSSLKRNTINFNGSYKLSKSLTANFSGNYVNSAAVGRPGTGYDGNNIMQQFNQWGQRQWNLDKTKNYKLPNGRQRTWNRISPSDAAPKYTDNPYWVRHESYQNDGRDRAFGNIGLTWKIIEGLSVTAKAATDFYTDKREERVAVGSNNESEYSNIARRVQETNLDIQLNYSRKLGSDIGLASFVGANRRYKKYWRSGASSVGGLNAPNWYNLKNSNQPAEVEDYFEEREVQSMFGSVSVDWKRQIFLDLTARNEWASTLPDGDNSYFFPAASLSWVFSEMVGQDWFSFGKARVSWGQVGSDTEPYRLIPTFEANTGFGSSPSLTVPAELQNSELKPELTTEIEAGVDLRFFNNRLGVDFTYYDRRTDDQIIPLSISAASNYTSAYVNAGRMTNKGFELMLSGTPIKNEIQWDVSFNIAKNENMVDELYHKNGVDVTNYRLINAPFAVSVNAREGEPFGTILGYKYTYDENGNRIVKNGKYVRSENLEPIGSALAEVTGGLTNSLSYKNFSFSFLVDFQFGGEVFSTTNMWAKYSGITEETIEDNIREYGTVVEGVDSETGQPNQIEIDANTHFFNNGGYRIAEADVYSTDYVYLRQITLGYRFPKSLLGNLPIQNLKVSLLANNLWLLYTRIPHLDPSNLAVSSTNIQGIEGASLPSVRSYGFNLSVSF